MPGARRRRSVARCDEDCRMKHVDAALGTELEAARPSDAASARAESAHPCWQREKAPTRIGRGARRCSTSPSRLGLAAGEADERIGEEWRGCDGCRAATPRPCDARARQLATGPRRCPSTRPATRRRRRKGPTMHHLKARKAEKSDHDRCRQRRNAATDPHPQGKNAETTRRMNCRRFLRLWQRRGGGQQNGRPWRPPCQIVSTGAAREPHPVRRSSIKHKVCFGSIPPNSSQLIFSVSSSQSSTGTAYRSQAERRSRLCALTEVATPRDRAVACRACRDDFTVSRPPALCMLLDRLHRVLTQRRAAFSPRKLVISGSPPSVVGRGLRLARAKPIAATIPRPPPPNAVQRLTLAVAALASRGKCATRQRIATRAHCKRRRLSALCRGSNNSIRKANLLGNSLGHRTA